MNVENIQDIYLKNESFNYTFTSKNEKETRTLASHIASNLKKGDITALNGELGAGKTTFMQGIAKYFDIEEQISSPTFTIVNEYSLKDGGYIFHFDVYRVEDSEEFEDTIGTEYFENGISIIEWANIIEDILPKNTIHIDISKNEKENERIFTIWR